MSLLKVVFLGATGCGKTQLINRIALPDCEFKSDWRTTIGPDFMVRKLSNNVNVQLWDLPGDARFEELSNVFMEGADVGVFCVDLTRKFGEEEEFYLEGRIMKFREMCPDAPLILVGTKADLPSFDNFEKIQALGYFSGFAKTSAKNNKGLEVLFSTISTHAVNNDENQFEQSTQSRWDTAEANLLASLENLPKNKQNRIRIELAVLGAKLPQNFEDLATLSENEVNAIVEFADNCEKILAGNYSTVLNAVLTVAAVALVTVIAAVIGFGIGFACGWWTGPGAFFTGLAAGYAAAATVTAASIGLGLIGGGLTAYGLFSAPKEMTAINEFRDEIILPVPNPMQPS